MQVKLKTVPQVDVMVDAEDLPLLNKYHWYSQTHNRQYTHGQLIGNTKKRIYLHRLIMDAPKGVDVDHIDGNVLNNSRSNLRLATRSLNNINRGKRNQDTSSKYKGVGYCKNTGRWVSQCSTKWLGRHDTQEDAAKAYDKAAKEMYGPNIEVNFNE